MHYFKNTNILFTDRFQQMQQLCSSFSPLHSSHYFTALDICPVEGWSIRWIGPITLWLIKDFIFWDAHKNKSESAVDLWNWEQKENCLSNSSRSWKSFYCLGRLDFHCLCLLSQRENLSRLQMWRPESTYKVGPPPPCNTVFDKLAFWQGLFY